MIDPESRRKMGVTEHPPGSNGGPDIDQFLAWVGLGPGYAWCAAFTCWSIHQAATALGVTPTFVKSAGALALWAKNKNRQFTTLTADDVPCVVVWNHGKGMGHVGMVVGVADGTNLMETIEGNSDLHGSRTGGQVCAHSDRTLDDPKLMGFLRIE